jgi:glycerol uptake facilitator-like aquaporin
LLLGLWILTIFGYRISGSHYNPAISFAFMFRKDIGHFPRPLGLAYMLFQFGGGVLGALLSWLF